MAPAYELAQQKGLALLWAVQGEVKLTLSHIAASYQHDLWRGMGKGALCHPLACFSKVVNPQSRDHGYWKVPE